MDTGTAPRKGTLAFLSSVQSKSRIIIQILRLFWNAKVHYAKSDFLGALMSRNVKKLTAKAKPVSDAMSPKQPTAGLHNSADDTLNSMEP